MKFSLDGRDYSISLDRLSVAEARAIKTYTGVSISALQQLSFGVLDVDVLAAVVFLAKRRAGEDVDWAAIDEIDVLSLLETFADDSPAEPPAGSVEPAPTANGARKNGRTRTRKPPAKTATWDSREVPASN